MDLDHWAVRDITPGNLRANVVPEQRALEV